MAWWQILVGILLFIVALSVLIGIHELGHLAMAKLFKVYCFNYSIGFGPVLLSSKRSKKHETIWTLRAIPLGGFVSMYGEGAELDTDEYIPPSRSLEGVARYKRGIIVSAGVILNFVLGFFLILCSNLVVQTKFYFKANSESNYYESCIVLSTTNNDLGIKTKDALWGVQDPASGEFVLNYTPVKHDNVDYLVCFSNSVTNTKVDPKLSDSLVFYKKVDVKTAIENAKTNFSNDKKFGFIAGQNRADVLCPIIYSNEKIPASDTSKRSDIYNQIKSLSRQDQINKYEEEITKAYEKRGFKAKDVAILTTEYFKPTTSSEPFTGITLDYYPYNSSTNKYGDKKTTKQFTVKPGTTDGKWQDIGLNFLRHQYRYTAGEVFKYTWNNWCNANTAVIRGVGALVTGRGQVSGIVGIASLSVNTLANFGFERFLYLWGMISCNLAIINLLPFPGLDGFTLVITAYEGIRKKQVPAKLKGILSFIGLALLFTLMIVVLVMDIVRMIP